jgi:hypothetical protein
MKQSHTRRAGTPTAPCLLGLARQIRHTAFERNLIILLKGDNKRKIRLRTKY